jgi:hypothetical protein
MLYGDLWLPPFGSPRTLRHTPMRKWVWILTFASAGCSEPTGPRVVANPDVAVKVPAIKEAVLERDRSEIPAMIDELNSDDPAVRLYAIEGLRRLTNETFGYRYYDDEERRKTAIHRWRAWSRQQTELVKKPEK